MTGGRNADGTFSSALIYDPGADTWATLSNTMALGRYNHTATLLPNGRVFVSGGQGANVWATAELYDRGLGQAADWRPSVTTATDPLHPGSQLIIGGSGLRGISQASGGNGSQDSATGYPLLQLRHIDNEQMLWVSGSFTDTSFEALPLPSFRVGHAMVTVFTNGIPSISRIIRLESPTTRVYLPLVLR